MMTAGQQEGPGPGRPDDVPRQPSRCDICGVTDVRGKHHVVTGVSMSAEGPVMQVESRHFSCCLSGGCPDGTCEASLAAEKPVRDLLS